MPPHRRAGRKREPVTTANQSKTGSNSNLCPIRRENRPLFEVPLSCWAVGAMIEHEVVRPDLVRPAWRLRPWPNGRDTLPRPLARQLQARRLPQAIGPTGAHAIAVAAEKDANAAVAVARILCRQLLHPLDHPTTGVSFAALRLR